MSENGRKFPEEKVTIFLSVLGITMLMAGYLWVVQEMQEFNWLADLSKVLAYGSWGALLVLLGIQSAK